MCTCARVFCVSVLCVGCICVCTLDGDGKSFFMRRRRSYGGFLVFKCWRISSLLCFFRSFLHRGTGLSCVVDTIVQGLGPPQGVRVVKLEKVDPLPGIDVRSGVHLLVTVPPESGKSQFQVREDREVKSRGFAESPNFFLGGGGGGRACGRNKQAKNNSHFGLFSRGSGLC